MSLNARNGVGRAVENLSKETLPEERKGCFQFQQNTAGVCCFSWIVVCVKDERGQELNSGVEAGEVGMGLSKEVNTNLAMWVLSHAGGKTVRFCAHT